MKYCSDCNGEVAIELKDCPRNKQEVRMEAKVIIVKCIQEAIDKVPMEVTDSGFDRGLREREEAIAEISFKAGIKKVMDIVLDWVTLDSWKFDEKYNSKHDEELLQVIERHLELGKPSSRNGA